jgi:uncharacterized protein
MTISKPMSERSDLPRAQPCPICRKPAVEQFRPFCSKRCADVDLGRWLSDVYVVPGRDDEEEEERTRPAKQPGDET